MDNINNMPRKIFNFDSAINKYREELSNINTNEVMKEVLQKGIEKKEWRKFREDTVIYIWKTLNKKT